MTDLRRVGYSDKVFFHKYVRNLRIRVVLKKVLELDKLKKAVAEALDDFEEYRVTPVRKNGDLFYETNAQEVAFFPDDDTQRYFGTDEVNGYLFYILYGESSFMLSLFHGLTDYKGMWAFLNDIIYRYAVLTGMDVPDIRIKAEPLSDEDRYDPYSLYADKDAEDVRLRYKCGVLRLPCVQLPHDDLAPQHEYTLTISASKFLNMVHDWNTSASCALAAIINNALAELYDAGYTDVGLKVTCDMRPQFGSHSRVNMSEAVMLISSKELRDRPLSEHSAALRAMMKSQFTKENFQKLMAISLEAIKVKTGEKDEPDLFIPSPKLTYVLTYPGKMDLPEEYGELVSDFELKGFFPIESIRFSIKSTGDNLRIGVDQVFDGDEVIRAIEDIFIDLGFETEVKNEGLFNGDSYSFDRIRELK